MGWRVNVKIVLDGLEGGAMKSEHKRCERKFESPSGHFTKVSRRGFLVYGY